MSQIYADQPSTIDGLKAVISRNQWNTTTEIQKHFENFIEKVDTIDKISGTHMPSKLWRQFGRYFVSLFLNEYFLNQSTNNKILC